MSDRTHTPRGGGWSVTLYASAADHRSATVQAAVQGLDRRDTAILMAARSLCGVDVSMPAAKVAVIAGPGGNPVWTLAAQ